MRDFQSRIIFSAAVLAAAIATLVIVWNGRYILLLLFGGAVGALLLSIPTSWVQKKLRLPRPLALSFVLLGVTGVLAAVAAFRGPALLLQLSTLQTDLPESVQQILTRINAQAWSRWVTSHMVTSAGSSDGFSAAVSGIRSVMSVTSYTLAGMVVVLFTSIFLALEPDFYLRGLRRLTPVRHRAQFDVCLAGAGAALQSWLVAKLVSMVVIGVLVALGLWALRVPLPGTLGLIASLLTFIPNLGPVLSVVPAALLAFAISPVRGLLTLLLFGLVHFLESNVVTPLAERTIVRLPPALTLAVQLLLASMTGLLGVAIAAPLTAVLLGIFSALPPREHKTRTTAEDLDIAHRELVLRDPY